MACEVAKYNNEELTLEQYYINYMNALKNNMTQTLERQQEEALIKKQRIDERQKICDEILDLITKNFDYESNTYKVYRNMYNHVNTMEIPYLESLRSMLVKDIKIKSDLDL